MQFTGGRFIKRLWCLRCFDTTLFHLNLVTYTYRLLEYDFVHARTEIEAKQVPITHAAWRTNTILREGVCTSITGRHDN